MPKSRLSDILLTQNSNAYALIDAAKMEELTTQLLIYEPLHCNLFVGQDVIELEEVAPYLVALHHNDAFTAWVMDEVYGNDGAIFLHSTHDIDTLASHFREYLYVTREIPHPQTGKPVIQEGVLAFYDPRVLPAWLESIEAETKTAFLSPLEMLYCEDALDKRLLQCYTPQGSCKTLSLAQEEQQA